MNQRFPSEPETMEYGSREGVGSGNSVIVPSGVTRPILLPIFSVNQTFPSGPFAIPQVPDEAGNPVNDQLIVNR